MGDFLKSISKFIFSRWLMGILALLGAVALFRPYWFYEPKTEIIVELISTAPVFSVNTDLGKLNVLYDGKDITSLGGAIYSMTVKVVNNGRTSVRKGDYDEKFPLRVAISGGQILEPPTVRSSNVYLKEALKVSSTSATEISFNPVILDPQDSFTLSLLILGKKDAPVVVSAHGKIAGQESIPVTDISVGATKKSLWSQVFEGDVLVHLARVVSYVGIFFGVLFLFVVTMIAITVPFDVADNIIDRRLRKQRLRVANDYIESEKLTHTKVRDFVLSAYVDQKIRRDSMYELLMAVNEGRFDFDKESVKAVLTLPAKLEGPSKVSNLAAYRRKYDLEKLMESLESEFENFEDLEVGLKTEINNFLSFLNKRNLPRRVDVVSRSFQGPFYKDVYKDAAKFEWAVAH